MASVIEFQLRNRQPRRTSAIPVMAEIIILPTVRIERLPIEAEAPGIDLQSGRNNHNPSFRAKPRAL